MKHTYTIQKKEKLKPPISIPYDFKLIIKADRV